MTDRFYCSANELQSTPIRRVLGWYMRFSSIQKLEALNCGNDAGDMAIGADIGDRLKQTMNRWKADGMNTETGRIDYEQLSTSEAFQAYTKGIQALRVFDPAVLQTANERKAFWINIYNMLMIHGVIAYRARKSIWEIKGAYDRIAYIIGGYRYSIDDIEHGILRANAGHVAIPGPRFADHDPRRQYCLDTLDPRIHFTLVCATESCPPIGIYQTDLLDQQLGLATRNFINHGGVVLNKAEMRVSLSRLFSWYGEDFGGRWMALGSKAIIIDFIAEYMNNPDDAKFLKDHARQLKVAFLKYDWSLNV